MAGSRGSLSDVRYLSSRERGLLRQGSGPARQTLGFVRQTYGFARQTYGFVRQTYGFVRQTYGFDLKKRVFAFFPSKISEISNFITLPILSELSH